MGAAQPGRSARPPQGGGVKNAVLMEIDGEPAGYALYRLNLEVGGRLLDRPHRCDRGDRRRHASRRRSSGACCSRWTGWRRARAYLLPVDHPLFHMLRYPRRMKMRMSDGLWVRLVDVGAALSARTYASDEPVVFEVDDPFLPDNSGRWRLADGQAERTDDEADLALDVGELGAAYLGGFTLRRARAGGARDGAAAKAPRGARTRSSAPSRSRGVRRFSSRNVKSPATLPSPMRPPFSARSARCSSV